MLIVHNTELHLLKSNKNNQVCVLSNIIISLTSVC